MADRTKIETGSQQKTLLNPDRNSPDIDYNANVRRDDTLGASLDAGRIPEQEEKAILDAQNQALKEYRRDKRREEKLPSDPLDPELSVERGPKNPHKR